MSYLLISFQILICDWLRIDIESHALMEKLDKTKVKVLEQASNDDSSKTAGTNAASTEVRLSLLLYTASLFALSLTLDLVSVLLLPILFRTVWENLYCTILFSKYFNIFLDQSLWDALKPWGCCCRLSEKFLSKFALFLS